MTKANIQEQYVTPDGRLTIDGYKLIAALDERLTAAEAKLTAIAALADPTGGATVDAEARAAIVAILDAAG